MNNEQPIALTDVSAELKRTIENVTTTQATFSLNATEYNAAVNDGLKNMQTIISDINGLIDQITVLINGLKNQIAVFEAKQLADPTPKLTAEIEQLQNQLIAAQATQAEAADTMQKSIDALNANDKAMSNSTNAQNVAALNATINDTANSLNNIKTKLQTLIQNTPASTLNPNAAPFEPASRLNPNAAEFVPGAKGGKRQRRRKTAKKQRKTRRRKTMKRKRNQKGGYVYNTKRNSDSDSGRGRGINTKRKKRKSTR